MPSTQLVAVPETSLLYKMTPPYKPDSWRQALADAGLSNTYPTLIIDIIHGSPIGNFLPLVHTFIPQNLASANLKPAYIDSELDAEVSASRMSGPFPIKATHLIFKGHFRASPLGLVEKPGKPGALWLICHLSKADHNGESTNG